MIMSDDEIVREYKAAKKKSKSIEILADLNATSKDDIKDLLRSKGVTLPGFQPGHKHNVKNKNTKESTTSNNNAPTVIEESPVKEEIKEEIIDPSSSSTIDAKKIIASKYTQASEKEIKSKQDLADTLNEIEDLKKELEALKSSKNTIPPIIKEILEEEVFKLKEQCDTIMDKILEINKFLDSYKTEE